MAWTVEDLFEPRALTAEAAVYFTAKHATRIDELFVVNTNQEAPARCEVSVVRGESVAACELVVHRAVWDADALLGCILEPGETIRALGDPALRLYGRGTVMAS